MSDRADRTAVEMDSHATADENLTWEVAFEDTQTASQDLADEFGWLREGVRDLDRDAAEGHRRALEMALNERTAEKGRAPSNELLRELSSRWGFAWATVADLLDVSVPALRKWRHGGGVSSENRLKIARLCALCSLLAENCAIPEPAVWLDTPLLADRYVSPRKLYRLGTSAHVALIEFAGLHHSPEELLDRVEPDWQDRYPERQYEVSIFEDGGPVIHRRPKG
ncbi:hypothetical protein [Actinoplanes subtropicus]|uniref:hypothetical protein n=1 Tax=Actinoplanes subtropicus TaxID=543632 RepID=UPI0012FCB9AF|nr:hypothetical protein [Actinoplanes subtropicus]